MWAPGTESRRTTLQYYVQPDVEAGELYRRIFESPWFVEVSSIMFNPATRVVTAEARAFACPDVPAAAPPLEPDFTIVGSGIGSSDTNPEIAAFLVSSIVAVTLAMFLFLCVCARNALTLSSMKRGAVFPRIH